MYNNLINTAAQDFSNERNSPIRVCNKNNIGLINNKWKVLDYRKVIMKAKQPLSIYYKLGALLTNCLTRTKLENILTARHLLWSNT